MKVNSPWLKGASKQAAGLVASGGFDGYVYLRGMPRKGNQGKAEANLIQQAKATALQRGASVLLQFIRLGFIETKKPLSAYNEFQKMNFANSAAIYPADTTPELILNPTAGAIDKSKLAISKGSIYDTGLSITDWTATTPGTYTFTPVYSQDATATTRKLAIVAFNFTSRQSEYQVLTLTQAQAPTLQTFSYDVVGEEVGFYACWVDSVNRKSSNSIYIAEL